MQYYLAPMEGLTDSVYRKLHHTYFPGITRYYTPFLSPTVHQSLTKKEQREIPMADTLGYPLVPQALTKHAEDFLWLARHCADRGYRQIDLNLGCPSGTVTAKGKGSGMLRDTAHLQSFLDDIFKSCPIDISVKTRLGFYDSTEFPAILEILSGYPIKELTIHPRVREDFYKGAVDMDSFAYAAERCPVPLCYNGNICSMEELSSISARFPQVKSIMIGRGLIGDPGMLTPGGTQKEALRDFCSNLFEEYTVVFGSSRNALGRMKENWRYLHRRFEDSDKLYKQLRKTTDPARYEDIAREIFATLPLKKQLEPDW